MNKEPKNTYSAGGVVLNEDGKVLVVDQGGLSWSLPKGHIDEGEDELTAAIREIYEESGVRDLKLIKKLGTYKRFRISKEGGNDVNNMKTITLFLFKTEEKDLKPIDPLNQKARWVEKEKVAALLTHPKDGEFFESILDELK